MDIAILHLPTRLADSARLARQAEELGLRWLGVADSPRIYGSLYPTIQHMLAATSTIKVGPLVTNPVTRHSSVHAATFAAFEEAYPRRSFLGVAAGDSAVHSVGLGPGGPARVAELVDVVRTRCGPDLRIATAIGGPVAARWVSARSDTVLFGCGLNAGQIRALEAELPASGSTRRRWIYAPSYLLADESRIPAARREVRAPVVSYSRHALHGDVMRKGVPQHLARGLTELYRRYDFAQHSKLGSNNAELLDVDSDEGRYLFGRFALVDTPRRAAERVADLAAEIGDFDLVLGTLVPDRDTHVRNIADAFRTRLDELR